MAATSSDDAHRNIDVTAGKIYVADPINATGKIISFAADTLRLPDTADIYEYHIIVTDENSDGTGAVSAVADLPTDGTEFYVLGEVEAHKPTITLGAPGIIITDKQGGGIPEIRISYILGGDVVSVDVDDTTIIIKANTGATYKALLSALQGNSAATTLVGITTEAGYTTGASGTEALGIINDRIGGAKFSGGGSGTKAQVEIAGLIIEGATAGVSGDNLTLFGQETGVADSSIVSPFGGGTGIIIKYDADATLDDLKSAINDNESRATAREGANYDGSILLSEVLFATYTGTPEAGGEPETNDTGTEQTGAHTWTDEATLDPDDFTIKLRPEDSAAEAVPDTDGDPATPEAEATKPSIGSRILDYLFGSQEEHRQMQNQQAENMFSGDNLDDLGGDGGDGVL